MKIKSDKLLRSVKDILLGSQPMIRKSKKIKYITKEPIEITSMDTFTVSLEIPVHRIVAPVGNNDFYIEVNGKRLEPGESIPYNPDDVVTYVIPDFFSKKCACDNSILWSSGCQCGGK